VKNKSRLNQLRTNWFKTTTQIFQANLDPHSIAVYCYLCSVSEGFNPSVRHMAKVLSMSKSTIKRAIDTLKDRNIIRMSSGPALGKSTHYEFVAPERWQKESEAPPSDVDCDGYGDEDNEF
jgi:DNA-binding MarR family transcriptional regulator